ncbi:MAG: chromate transporter [Desulfitobacteriaceae bacterium]|nr:chromate transporter [Desulfitobacteriaceae bacterium]MDD4752802.1 chromate transporter [Desulfitobacteriaceae bacterium]
MEGKELQKSGEKKNLIWNLFWTFCKIGAFTIGGGYVMLPLIENAIVREKKWLESEDYLDMIAVSQAAPGVIAVNAAVSVGYRIAGLSGAVAATIGAALPSFLIILVVARFFLLFQGNRYVEAFFLGARPAVVVLLIFAAYNMGKKAVRDKAGLVVLLLGLLGLLFLELHPIIAIIGAGLFGALYYRD